MLFNSFQFILFLSVVFVLFHHAEMMPRFAQRLGKSKLATSLMIESTVFVAGLVKKILLAEILEVEQDQRKKLKRVRDV